jgi:hypothetical protein
MVDMLAERLPLAERDSGEMKVLAIASEPISPERRQAALGGAIDHAEIMVVAPALHRSVLRFSLSDADKAIRRAELVRRETVEGIDAAALQQRFGLPIQGAE